MKSLINNSLGFGESLDFNLSDMFRKLDAEQSETLDEDEYETVYPEKERFREFVDAHEKQASKEEEFNPFNTINS